MARTRLMLKKGFVRDEITVAWRIATQTPPENKAWEHRMQELMLLVNANIQESRKLLYWAIHSGNMGDTGLALELIERLPVEEKAYFVSDLIWLGTSERWHYFCWEIIRKMPRDWLESHFDSLIEQLLSETEKEEHAWVYIMLFNGFTTVDDTLGQRLIQKALTCGNEEVVAEARHWL